MRSLNKARTSSPSLNVKRLRLAVIAIARLTFANMAADSGVLLGIILVRSSFAIRYFSSERGRTDVRRATPTQRFGECSHRSDWLELALSRLSRMRTRRR